MKTPEDVVKSVRTALDAYAFDELAEHLRAIRPRSFTTEQSEELLGELRRKRRFPDLERTAGLFLAVGRNTPKLRRLYAQALLDQSRVSDALDVLGELQNEVAGQPEEGEVRGLIGRGLKQRFVDEHDAASLTQAIDAYRWGWENDKRDRRWHGINVVALLARAHREGIDRPADLDAQGIAKEILGAIENVAEPTVWDAGTALEASIALGDRRRAFEWLKRYANDPRADEFELASTRRQLSEVWRLDDLDLGRDILPVLAVAQASRSELAPVDLHRVGTTGDVVYEAVYGPESTVKLAWVKKLLSVAASVARIENDVGTVGGTGFLIQGADVSSRWNDATLFVTNAHVVSNDPADEAPFRMGQCIAHFLEVEGRPQLKLPSQAALHSPRAELDVAIFAVTAPDGCALVPRAPGNPVADDKQRIYVIGHGAGEDLSISLYNNRIADYDQAFVHYRSPTKPGHSGSPVFNAQLDAFAVHHAARKTLEVNEGILLDAYR